MCGCVTIKGKCLQNICFYFSQTTIMPRTRRPCEICQSIGARRHLKKHHLQVHIPWYVNLATACISCHVAEGCEESYTTFHSLHEPVRKSRALLFPWFCLINGMLLFIMRSLGVGESSLEDLLMFVVGDLISLSHPLVFSFTEDEYFYLKEYDTQAGLAPLTKIGYENSTPSRVCVLLHHTLLIKLISKLDPNAQTQLLSIF